MSDVRPTGVNLRHRPGQGFSVDVTGPADWRDNLATVTSTLDGTALTVSGSGDVITVTVSDEAAPDTEGTYTWLLTDSVAGVFMGGHWTASNGFAGVPSNEVTVTLADPEVSVTVLAGPTAASSATSGLEIVSVTGDRDLTADDLGKRLIDDGSSHTLTIPDDLHGSIEPGFFFEVSFVFALASPTPLSVALESPVDFAGPSGSQTYTEGDDYYIGEVVGGFPSFPTWTAPAAQTARWTYGGTVDLSGLGLPADTQAWSVAVIDRAGVLPGDVVAGFDSQDGTDGYVLYSPDGSDHRITVNNDGRLVSPDGTFAFLSDVSGIPASLIDAAGDLIVGSADDTAARLGLGSALQHLRVNAGGTALEYADPPSGVAAGGDAETLWLGTETEYAAIGSPDANTVYVVTPDP